MIEKTHTVPPGYDLHYCGATNKVSGLLMGMLRAILRRVHSGKGGAKKKEQTRSILLVTPPLGIKGAGYGGGMGGYAQMGQILLANFESPGISLLPCYHTVRKEGRFYALRFPGRLILDAWRVFALGMLADGVHMTLQYRRAIVREFTTMLISRILRLPVLVDIRAGCFVDWYQRSLFFERWMARTIMRLAQIIAVEGMPYVSFVEKTFRKKAVYLPNFVNAVDVTRAPSEKCIEKTLKVMFVGYCYEGKGVIELVEGCAEAARRGVHVALSLVGEEENSLATWLSAVLPGMPEVQVRRLGRQRHHEVMSLYERHDIFCMPTRHLGEGHSNATNEAMARGMVVICTRHGFLGTILDERSCYFVESNSSSSIAKTLCAIDGDRELARRKAKEARKTLEEKYSAEACIPVVARMYRELLEI